MDYIRHTIMIEAIQNNFSMVCNRTQANVGAVIKANAYGHGNVEVAHALVDAGCNMFFTGSVAEAVYVRQHGITGTIIPLLGVLTQEEVRLCTQYNLVPVFHTKRQLELLRSYKGLIAIKCDTGMSRLGFAIHEIEDVLSICKQCGIEIGYVLSHLTTGSDTDNVIRQQQEFNRVFALIRNQYKNVQASLGNSGSLDSEIALDYDIVRCGIALYGYDVAIEGLQPAMEVYTAILQMHTITQGRTVSYNNTFIAPHDMRVAVVASGYAYGYHRMSENAFLIIEGERAPIVGTICMQLCIVDISHIKNVTYASKAYILQPSCGLCATTIAQSWNTISYEVLCALGKQSQW